MPDLTVTLSADERQLLKAMDGVYTKEIQVLTGFEKIADGSDKATQQIREGFARMKNEANDSLKGLLRDLRRTGPEGRKIAAELQTHFADVGKGGFESIDTLIGRLHDLDPEAAQAATAVRDQFDAAHPRMVFDQTIRDIRSLGGTADKTIREMQEMFAAAKLEPDTDHFVQQLRELNPQAANVAETVRDALWHTDPGDTFDVLRAAIKGLGPEAIHAADAIEKHLGEVHPPHVDAYMRRLREIAPVAVDQAHEIHKALLNAPPHQLFDAIRSEIRALSTEAQAVAEDLIFDMSSVRPPDLKVFTEQLAEIAPEAAVVAERVRVAMESADPANPLAAVHAAVTALGGDAETAAQQVTAALASAGTRDDGLQQYLANLRELGPVAAHVADQIETKIAEADRQADFDNTLAELQALGGEAEAIAKGIADDMAEADREAAGDMNAVLDRLKQIDPTVAESATRVREELAEAARYSEGKFAETLDTLRGMGPVGRQVAEELKSELVAAGQVSERSIEDVVAELRKIDPAAGDAADAITNKIRNSTNKGKGFFRSLGESAVGQIQSIAGAYVGVQEAIQAVIDINRKVIETNREIFDGLRNQTDGNRRLLQLANTTEEFDQLRSTAERLSSTYGIDRDQAANLVFAAESENFSDAVDFIASNQQAIRVESQARVAGQVPALFQDEGLSPQQAINLTLSAARSSNADFEDIAASIPVAAEGASLTGASAAETAGALAALSTRFSTVNTAADRLKGLALKFDTDTEFGLSDIGLIAGVERLQSLSEEDRRSFLGESQELNTAFNIFSQEIDTVRSFRDAAQRGIDTTGTASSPTALKRNIAGTDARLQSVVRESSSANSLEISRERNRAATEGNRRAQRNNALTSAENNGVSGFRIALAETVAEGAELVGVHNTAPIINGITSEPLSNLRRDLSLATEHGDEDAADVLAATDALSRRRTNNPNAILSRDESATLLNGLTDRQDFLPNQVGERLRRELTDLIDQQSEDARGLVRSLSVSTLGLVGLDGAGASDGSQATDAIQLRVIELLQEQISETRRQNELLERQASASEASQAANQQTAANTQPRQPDPNAIMTASMAEADARAQSP
ncbi:MAG: hypothetical protein AAGC97_03550 [Planctomycetota bacterium]